MVDIPIKPQQNKSYIFNTYEYRGLGVKQSTIVDMLWNQTKPVYLLEMDLSFWREGFGKFMYKNKELLTTSESTMLK